MNDVAKKRLILALETSSRKGSVALGVDDKMLAERVFSGPLTHSAEIFPSIRRLLDKYSRTADQIEHIYISVGPGSFTGLRIAVTIAKIMQLAHPIRIAAVDSLDVVAANVVNLAPETPLSAPEQKFPAVKDEAVAAVLDAKRGQFFIAVYERQSDDKRKTAGLAVWRKVLPDSLMTASQFLDRFGGKDKPVRLLGDGLLYYKDKFRAGGVHFFDKTYWSPRAGKVLLLGRQMALQGQFADALTLRPNYLRKPDVTIKRR